MGLYLWHVTAVFAVAGLVLFGANLALPEPWSWEWWATRPHHLAAATLLLVALVTVTAPAERALDRLTSRPTPPLSGRPRTPHPESRG